MAYQKDGPHSTLGPSHRGEAKPGFFAKPDGSDALLTHHNPRAARIGDKPEPAHERFGHRGHAVGAVVDGKIVRARGAVDVQPRHGKSKVLPDVPVHLGHRSRTSPLPGMLHLTDVHGVPDAANPNPLDVMTPSQRGKRQPPTYVHDGMTAEQIANARFNGEAVLREGIAASEPDHPARMAATLPESTSEN